MTGVTGRAGLAGLALLFLAGTVSAQDSEAEELEKLGVEAADLIGRLDLDVPDSPAFAILGIAPQNIVNPDTPAELATAIFVGDDDDGNSQEGLALEFRPYLMARGSDLTLGDYVHNPWLARMALSFADAEGTSDVDETSRKSLGLSFTPIDKRDPISSSAISECLGYAQEKAPAEAGQQDGRLRRELREAIASGDQQRIDVAEAAMAAWFDGARDAYLEKAGTRCMEDEAKKTANAAQLQLGIAYHESEIETINESGAAAWVSYAFPVGAGSVIAHARFSDDIVVADEEQDSYLVRDETVVGGRYRLGDDRRAILLEAAYVDQSEDSGDNDDDYTTVLVGAEFRVAESLWIQFAVGDRFGSSSDSGLALSGQFRWAVSKSRLWPGAK